MKKLIKMETLEYQGNWALILASPPSLTLQAILY